MCYVITPLLLSPLSRSSVFLNFYLYPNRNSPLEKMQVAESRSRKKIRGGGAAMTMSMSIYIAPTRETSNAVLRCAPPYFDHWFVTCVFRILKQSFSQSPQTLMMSSNSCAIELQLFALSLWPSANMACTLLPITLSDNDRNGTYSVVI